MSDDMAERGDGPPGKGRAGAIAAIGVLFFLFGFVTWLNGSLIPFLKIVCALDTTQAFLVTFAFYISYTVMALPMAAILARTGYRNGMALGLAVMAAGALIHVPAARDASFAMFLIGLFTLGAGLTILQTASNPYIVLLGPPESAARRISIMGVINKAAGVVVPMAFAAIVSAQLGDAGHAAVVPRAATRQLLAARLVLPYVAMAVVLVVLAAFVRLAPLPELTPEPAADGDDVRLIDRPRFVLGVATLFAYMGVEVLAGDTIGLFGQRLGVVHFLSLTSYTMVAMVLGYGVGIACIPRLIAQRTALIAAGAAGLVVTAAILLADPASTALSAPIALLGLGQPLPDPVLLVAALGFAHALVWPTVWPLALRGLGAATPRAAAVLIMAISGGALIPLLFGWLVGHGVAMQHGYALALPCYAMILFYGVAGCRMTRWRSGAPRAAQA